MASPRPSHLVLIFFPIFLVPVDILPHFVQSALGSPLDYPVNAHGFREVVAMAATRGYWLSGRGGCGGGDGDGVVVVM